ncbi:hypothetical protein FE782_22960 [Paenibacillus antri]|uniref:Flagellar hook-length control protein FliK n=1 Tax=Paenibacillus antri TaxID=2582848 RepID=A0A5R9G6A3_9BACL|nr:hypothetical protein [Paenibacillus antri]TLS49866.1 hypothetical protein FE782_22960 [Paenibacillus antri]
MDVGRLMRAALGDAAPAEPKTLELKPGQVVRGIVLQLFAENEALLNIGGTTMRAKLETPIPVGQATLFQVQPDSGSLAVLLKPLSASTVDIATESFAGVLKNFGMKDTPLNRAVVRVLHEEGVPMSRATNGAVASAVEALAPSGDAETDALLRAAATAAKRGLPPTAETVRALHTAMTGPSPTELHRALETGARDALAAPGTSAAAKQAATRLLEVLQRADALLGEALRPQAAADAGGARAPAAGAGAPPSAPGAAAAPGAPASAAGPQAAAPTAQAPGPAATGAPASALPAPGGAPTSAPPPAAPERPPLLSFLKLLGVDAEREWLKLAASPPPRPAQEAAAQSQPMDAPEGGEAPKPSPLAERPLRPLDVLPPPAPPTAAHAADGAASPSSAADKAPVETLKSLLSQIAADADVPPALKEAAQTALQSITGQQLLMAQDKSAPFAHVTMFVPLKGRDGEGDGNASVQIHTRRGKKGELDADNCRLWFQLSLASLGETWVDVTVMNKIVGLHVWNDHPAAQALMETQKSGMEGALREIGYQLLTFKHSAKPKETAATDAESQAPGGQMNVSSAYAPPKYKGVDFRV